MSVSPFRVLLHPPAAPGLEQHNLNANHSHLCVTGQPGRIQPVHVQLGRSPLPSQYMFTHQHAAGLRACSAGETLTGPPQALILGSVPDLPHQLFDDVLQEQHTAGLGIFTEHTGHMGSRPLHDGQGILDSVA